MLIGNNIDNANISVSCNGVVILPKDHVKLLGIILDSKLNFNLHIEKICKKVNRNTNALLRIRKYIDSQKAQALCKAYVLSHFNYCPLIWMFASKASYALIDKAQKRALRTVHFNFRLSLEELLAHDNSVSIHVQNLRCLMTEVFKSLHELNPSFMLDIFQLKETRYDLRSYKPLQLPKTLHYNHGIYGLTFRAAILWNQLPKHLKLHEIDTLNGFKQKIKLWDASNCTCKICR